MSGRGILAVRSASRRRAVIVDVYDYFVLSAGPLEETLAVAGTWLLAGPGWLRRFVQPVGGDVRERTLSAGDVTWFAGQMCLRRQLWPGAITSANMLATACRRVVIRIPAIRGAQDQ